jgi:hypothetical protein
MTQTSDTPLVELRDRILKERADGRIVFWGLPDELMAAPLDDFLKQPADGILYDLNRLEEVVLTFLPDPKWVNDFAVATVIRRLIADKDEAERSLAKANADRDALREALEGVMPMLAECDCIYSNGEDMRCACRAARAAIAKAAT